MNNEQTEMEKSVEKQESIRQCVYYLERCTPEDRSSIALALVALYPGRPACVAKYSPPDRCEHTSGDGWQRRRCMMENGHDSPHMMVHERTA